MPALSNRKRFLIPHGQEWLLDLFEHFDEEAVRQKKDAQIEQQQRAINLAGRIIVLRNMPGYDDFRKALQDMEEWALRQMVNSEQTDGEIRTLRGQCQAYNNILSVMDHGEKRIDALAMGLKKLQNERAVLEPTKKQEAKK